MAHRDDLEQILKQVVRGTAAKKLEDQRLDFKTECATPKLTFADLAEAAVCFANSAGGDIVVGVRDQPGGTDALIGTTLDAQLVRQRIHELTTPHLTVEAQTLDVDGVRLVVLTVPEVLDVFSTSKGHATRRIGDQCRPMHPDELVRLSDERRGVDWSAQLIERPLTDVDPSAVTQLQAVIDSSGRPGSGTLARLGSSSILNEFGLARDGRLTRAGELLLCVDASGAADEVIVYQHRRTPSGEADAVRRWGTPLILAFSEVMQVIGVRQGITPVTLGSGVQVQVEDFPTTAVREALVNALTHGDYRSREPVRIVHSPDGLIISSPGPLVTGVTTMNILTTGKPRFPLLAKAFRRAGLAEDLGQGVDRMYREMIRSGRDLPVISESSDRVDVLLPGGPPNRRIAEFVGGLPVDERDDTDTLLAIRHLCDRRTVSSSELAPVIQRRISEAQRVLLRLSTEPVNLLEPARGTEGRRHPSYRLRGSVLAALGPAVRYHRRARSEVDRKVAEHVREYGYINNSTMQRIFDLDVFQARDLLRDLVGRELLVRTSQQTRGTAVRYGPGPAFPKRARQRAREY